jgi:hypothetical protein
MDALRRQPLCVRSRCPYAYIDPSGTVPCLTTTGGRLADCSGRESESALCAWVPAGWKVAVPASAVPAPAGYPAFSGDPHLRLLQLHPGLRVVRPRTSSSDSLAGEWSGSGGGSCATGGGGGVQPAAPIRPSPPAPSSARWPSPFTAVRPRPWCPPPRTCPPSPPVLLRSDRGWQRESSTRTPARKRQEQHRRPSEVTPAPLPDRPQRHRRHAR